MTSKRKSERSRYLPAGGYATVRSHQLLEEVSTVEYVAPLGATSSDNLSSTLRLPPGCFCLITQPSWTISEESQPLYDSSCFLHKEKKTQDWNTLWISAESVDNLGSVSLGCHVCLSVVFSISELLLPWWLWWEGKCQHSSMTVPHDPCGQHWNEQLDLCFESPSKICGIYDYLNAWGILI